MADIPLYLPMLADTLDTDEMRTLSTEGFSFAFFHAHLTLGLHLAMGTLKLGVHIFQAVDKESLTGGCLRYAEGGWCCYDTLDREWPV